MWVWPGLQEDIIQTFWFASASETLGDDTDIFSKADLYSAHFFLQLGTSFGIFNNIFYAASVSPWLRDVSCIW